MPEGSRVKKMTHKLIAALEKGQNAALCTILESTGSSPRGAGGFCPYCGAKVREDYEFCNVCGEKLP